MLILASTLYYFHETGLLQYLYRRHANNNVDRTDSNNDADAGVDNVNVDIGLNNNNENNNNVRNDGNNRNAAVRNSLLPAFVVDLLRLSIGIPRTQGLAMDLVSFFGSFCLSLIPSWDPTGVE